MPTILLLAPPPGFSDLPTALSVEPREASSLQVKDLIPDFWTSEIVLCVALRWRSSGWQIQSHWTHLKVAKSQMEFSFHSTSLWNPKISNSDSVTRFAAANILRLGISRLYHNLFHIDLSIIKLLITELSTVGSEELWLIDGLLFIKLWAVNVAVHQSWS